MATMRLTFLYPHLFRSARVTEPMAQTARQCCRRQQPRQATFATTAARKNQRFVQRHGKAVEPFLPPGASVEDVKVFVPEPDGSKEAKPRSGRGPDSSGDAGSREEHESTSSSAALSEETQQAAQIVGERMESGGRQADRPTPLQQAAANTGDPNLPLETILHMDPPAEQPSDVTRLHPAPYVHHFDSYTLVRQIEDGGFTPDQAVTAMKAVRGLLAQNLEIAKEGLVSKSDVENETYLFRAACSELRTEIQNARRANEEKMRRERTLLQHEVDILNEKLNQELLTLKDELTGMFNDRKMAVRMEQRSMESKIQEINYKITVALNSDSKSEVEGLRWVLTRRSVLAIVFIALMVLSSLRYASYRAHEEETRRKKAKEQQRLTRYSPGAAAELPPVPAVEILTAN
ncbi:MAG: hypothetical protein M1818_000116 [Claussenomyces sp. TS43310]|nr:MAG: hypothetical protein M1818_000116 [Claussenomyces sp. TS43310]